MPELSRTIFQALNDGDLERAASCPADDAEITIVSFEQTFRGREGCMQFMRGLKTAFPNI